MIILVKSEVEKKKSPYSRENMTENWTWKQYCVNIWNSKLKFKATFNRNMWQSLHLVKLKNKTAEVQNRRDSGLTM